MSDLKSEIGSDIDQNYSLNNTADPKNVQELTIYVCEYWIVIRDEFASSFYAFSNLIPLLLNECIFDLLAGTKSIAKRAR